MRDCLVVLDGLRNSAQKGALRSNCHPAELTIVTQSATQSESVEHADAHIIVRVPNGGTALRLFFTKPMYTARQPENIVASSHPLFVVRIVNVCREPPVSRTFQLRHHARCYVPAFA